MMSNTLEENPNDYMFYLFFIGHKYIYLRHRHSLVYDGEDV